MKGQIKYERQLQNTFITIDEVNESIVEAYGGQVVLNGSIDSFADCKIINIDGKRRMKYDISNCQDLTTVYSVKKLVCKDVVSIITNLNKLIREMENYLMDGLQLVLCPEFIFLDLETHRIKFIYDFSESRRHSDVVKLGEFLINRVDHEDEIATSLAYYFFENSHNGNYSVERMEEYLEKSEKETKKIQEEKTTNNNDILNSRKSYNEPDEAESDLEIPVDRDDALDYLYGDMNYNEDLVDREQRSIFLKIMTFFKSKNSKKKESSGEKKSKKQTSKLMSREKGKTKNEPKLEYYSEEYMCEKVDRANNDNEESGHTVYIGRSARDRDYVLIELRKNKEITHKIDTYPFVLGTQKDSVNLYIKDSSVSRIHAKITKTKDAIYIEDMHSTNGTILNDLPLMPHEKNQIKRGDIITLGKTEFEFR